VNFGRAAATALSLFSEEEEEEEEEQAREKRTARIVMRALCRVLTHLFLGV
jgi:hypothetical protein